MIDAPETTLVVDDAYFTFDRDSLKVDSGLLQGDGLDATRLEASRRKRLDWLWQWAFWLDQSVEPLMQVPDDLTANMLLRALFDYSASDQDQRQAWVGIGAMPLFAAVGQLRRPPRVGAAQIPSASGQEDSCLSPEDGPLA